VARFWARRGIIPIKMRFLPYNTDHKEFSQMLRKNAILGEVLLWKELRTKKMKGYQFNRQKPLGNYIVDFYCKPLKLVIEIDGGSHHFEEVMVKDVMRQAVLEEMGLHLVRFTEMDVRRNMMQVLISLETHIENLENEI
jgi:very-short-patch-repair endonuclease